MTIDTCRSMTSLFSFTNILFPEILSLSLIAHYDDEGYPIEDEEWEDELDDEIVEDDEIIEEDVSFDEEDETEWE